MWVALLVVFGRGLGIGGDLLRLAGRLTIGLIIFVVVAMLVLRQYMRRQGAQLASLRGMLHAMRRQKLVWLVHGVLGLVVWGLYALKAHVVFLGLLGQGSLVLAFVVTMSAYAVALLPVSPGGLGTFEATFVTVSSPFGVSVEGALAVVVLLRLVTFWLSLAVSAVTVGWIVFIKRRHHTTASGFSG
ncbi:MAG: TIGR00374 family protein [Acholeplasmatales bacterium]|nr:MAG: TIGR00374 family protein [Acholeplasmatales bacterium]